MTTTTERASFHSLSPEEKRAWNDAAEERVRAVSREIAEARKAVKPDPRDTLTYRTYNTMGLVCVLVVKHRDGQASFHCSKSGGGLRFNLAFSKCIVQPESSDEFLLVCVPKWIAQDRGLMGVTPPLDGDWSDAQRATWDLLIRNRGTINTKIYYAKKRRASNFKRVDAA